MSDELVAHLVEDAGACGLAVIFGCLCKWLLLGERVSPRFLATLLACVGTAMSIAHSDWVVGIVLFIAVAMHGFIGVRDE